MKILLPRDFFVTCLQPAFDMKQIYSFIFAALVLLCAGCSGGTGTESGGETFRFGTSATPDGHTFLVDGTGVIIDGGRTIPRMGEIHYVRLPENEWRRELQKMKAGGIDIVATYVFWNYHEAEPGVFDWSGRRNLRRFIELCGECGLKVVLRIGPFCHGEVYLGGIPEWVVDNSAADGENWALRTVAPEFMEAVGRFYAEIGRQAQGLLWKDGGPVVGVQLDNESRGPWEYLAGLKELAVAAGFDVPMYTRTGWPEMDGPAVFGEILPLYGDYPDGFWDRELSDMPGSYQDAFRFRDSRLSAVIATETFGTDQSTEMNVADYAYPYFTCELGGGMLPSYHRRIHVFDNDALALAICKLGSGSNLPGYYMYHGGTNIYCEEHPMSEYQASKYTNYNDLPQLSYDYQAPLGEIGQPNASYHKLRLLHYMLEDWGGELAPMQPLFGEDALAVLSDNPKPTGGEEALEVAVRRSGTSGFVFVNNYIRMHPAGAKTLDFFGRSLTVPEGASFCFPFGLKYHGVTIDYATAQPLWKAGRTLYFVAVEGIEPEFSVNGKTVQVPIDEVFKLRGLEICVFSPRKALSAYRLSNGTFVFSSGALIYEDGERVMSERWTYGEDVSALRVDNPSEVRPAKTRIGAAGVAEQPRDEDFRTAAVWRLELPKTKFPEDCFLEISYCGDVARLYADGRLVQDNFWNGRTMLVRFSDLVGKELELKILPLSKSAPVYLQKAQRELLEAAEGDWLLELGTVRVLQRRSAELPSLEK